MKTVAITGSTGGLGQEVCFKLAQNNYNLILVDRNLTKSKELTNRIKSLYPKIKVTNFECNLEDIDQVKTTCETLKTQSIDYLILNAGIYNVPLKKLKTGFNNVFQINFISQYFLARELAKANKNLKIVATGSIAHNYSKLDENDVDFSMRKGANKIYGNSKRFLMFSLFEVFKNEPNRLSIVHPGVTLTNMTGHYPKGINWLVKIILGTFCPSRKKASRNIVVGVETNCEYLQWIGPCIFDVWGKPKVKTLKTCDINERERIAKIANDIYLKLKKQ